MSITSLRHALRPRRQRNLLAAIAVVGAWLVAPLPAHAATDTFLRFGPANNSAMPRITGETQDQKYKGAIELASWDWSAENPSTIGTSGGSGAGSTPKFNNVTFTKAVDRATPLFQSYLQSGAVIRSARFSVRKASTSDLPAYYELCLQNVVVTGSSVSVKASDDGPTETVSLAYGALEQRYVVGGTTTVVTSGWDLQMLKPVSFYNSCGS